MANVAARNVLRMVALLAFVAAAAGGGSAAEPSWSIYMHPGRMVDAGGVRLNMVCVGQGRPTVVFDSGLEDWAPAWITIQPVIARTTRACSYDRAGNGFSPPGPMPRTSARIVSELHAMLHNSGEPGPYILVGHSFGGINVRHYADRYPGDVAGLLLDDASAEGLVRFMSGKERRANDADIKSAQAALYRCEHLAEQGFRTATVAQRQQCPGAFFRGLPAPKDFPRELGRTLVSEAEHPSQYAASASEFTNFTTAGMETLLAEHRSYGSIPLRILVASHHTGMSSRDQTLWERVHRQWLQLSSDARYIAATRSGHYIQFDQPQLVIDAIRDEIRTARRTHPAHS